MAKKLGNPNWGKGKSANPGGRPKGYGAFKAAAQEHSAEALAKLIDMMRNPELNPAIHVAAAREILDRAWGRAAQAVTGEAGQGNVVYEIVMPKGINLAERTDSTEVQSEDCVH